MSPHLIDIVVVKSSFQSIKISDTLLFNFRYRELLNVFTLLLGLLYFVFDSLMVKSVLFLTGIVENITSPDTVNKIITNIVDSADMVVINYISESQLWPLTEFV